ncbi:MAG: glycoside hydrolase family 27 protein [Bacteroidota bacterium]
MSAKGLIAGAFLFFNILSQQYGQKFDSLAMTPPMGWNGWNSFRCRINESVIREVAQAMVASGMKDAGYNYLVLDDCWQIERDGNGTIMADPKRFPSGMKKLGEYIHSLGLKYGIYSDAGTTTCCGRPGSKGFEIQDAMTYASWGVDYLKYDWCSHGSQDAESSYRIMRDALCSAGRPVVYSICEWGRNKPWEWGKDIGHLWRSTPDIINCFDGRAIWGGMGVLQIIDRMADLGSFAGPGHWNDADMLQVGNGKLTPDEERLHFSMWAMFSSPLMAGNDIRNITGETLSMLTNREVIAIDQDCLGIPAIRWMKSGDLEIWYKPLDHGDLAFCLFNRGSKTIAFNQDLKVIGNWYPVDNYYVVRDLWKHKEIGNSGENLVGSLPPHGVLLVRLKKDVSQNRGIRPN